MTDCDCEFNAKGVCIKCFRTEAEIRWWPGLNDINRDTVRNQARLRKPQHEFSELI